MTRTSKRNQRRIAAALALAIAPLALPGTGAAATRYFIGTVNNNWYNNNTDPTNWNTLANGTGSSGLPVAGDNINITGTNGVSRTVNYDYSGSAAFSSLTVDLTSTGTLGTATEGLSMGANTLTVNGNEYVGYSGNGQFNQSGGTNQISNATLYLGYISGASGSYNFGGGQLTVNNGGIILGNSGGIGNFNQSNGSVSSGGITLNNGSYLLSGGNLAGGVSQVYGGRFNQSGGSFLANELDLYGGTFTQTGGTISTPTITMYNNGAHLTLTNFVLGSANGSNGATLNAQGSVTASSITVNPGGTFTESGGSGSLLTANIPSFVDNGGTVNYYDNVYDAGGIAAFTLTAGNLPDLATTNPQIVGNNGAATFNQTGGAHTVGSTSSSNSLSLGYNNGSSGNYILSGTGQLTVNGSVYVGNSGTGAFNQSGGTNNLTGGLYVGFAAGSTGAFYLSGGTMNLSSEAIGNGGVGLFSQTGGNHTITGGLTLATTLGSTGTYNLSGGTLSADRENLGVVTADLPGGGASFAPGGTALFVQTGGTNTITGTDAVSHSFNIYTGDSYNLSGGTLNLLPGQGTAVNAGLFTLTGTGALTGYLNTAPNISINGVTGATLSGFIMTGGTVGATATVENAGGVQIGGGAFAGTLINNTSGTVTQSAGTFSGALDNIGTYTLSGGTFSGTGIGGLAQNLLGGTFNLQAGGTLNVTTFTNQGTFFYTGGTFNGRLINQDTAVAYGPGLAFSNGMENDATLFLGSNGFSSVTFGGSGLDNFGIVGIAGTTSIAGTITNEPGAVFNGSGTISGTLINRGTLTPTILNVAGAVTNSGVVNLSTAGVLNATSGITNTGQILTAGGRITGGTVVNSLGGEITFYYGIGAVPATMGITQAVNNSGGVIVAASLVFVTLNSFSAGNTNGGDIQIQNNATLATGTAFPSSGTIELQGSGSLLSGGTITNTGQIIGLGRISSTVANMGEIEATAGPVNSLGNLTAGLLTLASSGDTNPAGGQLVVDPNATLTYSQGLNTSAGTITNNGGTFKNNNLPLSNTGIINGNGQFWFGGTGLTNAVGGIINVTAGTSFYGPVVQNGSMQVYGSTTYFYGPVTEGAGGKIGVTNGTVYFLGNTYTSVAGLYVSDPSINNFNGLNITATGNVSGGAVDQFIMLNGTTLNNAGSFTLPGTLKAAAVINSGMFIQTGTLIETGNFTNSGTATIGGTQNWSGGTVFTNTAGTASFTSDAGKTGEALTLNASGGSVSFSTSQHLASLIVGKNATAQLTGGGTGNRSMLYTPALSVAGTLDLTTNDLDVQNGGAAALVSLTSLIQHAYNNGTWTGSGITSTFAAADPRHLTTLGIVLNTGSMTSLDGSPVAGNDVLIKTTYYGDATLDGKVDASDYSRIDFGYLSHAMGWANGDFNYDGAINGSDYTLIDNAFNTQGATLAEQIAEPTAQITNSSAVPEPGSAALVGIGLIGLLRRRRIK